MQTFPQENSFCSPNAAFLPSFVIPLSRHPVGSALAANSASIIVHFGGMITAITRCEAFHLAAFLPPLPAVGSALAAPGSPINLSIYGVVFNSASTVISLSRDKNAAPTALRGKKSTWGGVNLYFFCKKICICQKKAVTLRSVTNKENEYIGKLYY